MKRALTVILAVLLLAALLASTALADAGLQNFTEKTPYDGRFIDVPQKAWYYGDVAKATSFGLIRGMTENTFAPAGKLTVAECITLAARMHSIYQTGGESFVQDKPWYQVYVDYALQNGCPVLRIDTNAKNTAARAMYAKHGYMESGVIPCVFNGIPGVDLVCMEKKI